MKQWILLSVMLGVLPLSLTAQDDLYFVPTKKAVQQARAAYHQSLPETYYVGSDRSVDEYNRRGSYYESIPGDSVSDIIDFDGSVGVYPDSTSDYHYTRELTRWDGYTPSGDAYWSGYSQGRRDSWLSWHSPWYYSSYYPWYDSWYYDPWYYDWGWSWHYGWYDPWYYSWRYPYYGYGWYGGGYYYPSHGGWSHHTGAVSTRSSRVISSGSRGVSPTGRFTGYSRTSSGSRISTGSYGGSRSSSVRSSSSSVRSSSPSRTTSPIRSSGSGYSPSYGSSGSTSSFGSRSSSSVGSSGGGSFGGSRSSGGSFGGSRSSGGSFGGSRSAGSGGSRGRR